MTLYSVVHQEPESSQILAHVAFLQTSKAELRRPLVNLHNFTRPGDGSNRPAEGCLWAIFRLASKLMTPDASTLPPSQPLTLSRREAIERILLAATLAASFDLTSFGADAVPGIGADPNLLKKEIPWPRVLTEAEKAIVTALGDVVIPADDHGPAASRVGIPDFIDEWVSAPYLQQQNELKIIRDGLAWIETAARKRFNKGFADVTTDEQTGLIEAIVKPDSEERKQAYAFFKLFRDRVAGGYYATKEGWKAIGYTGNLPHGFFAGPTPAVLKHVGLT